MFFDIRAIVGLGILVLGLTAGGGHFSVEQVGYNECFRLDREPLEDELTANCTDPTNNEAIKRGTFHRYPDREMKADIVPVSMSPERAAKLPLSSCLWTAKNNSGSGDRLAPVWEPVMDLNWTGSSNAEDVWRVSACRWDPLHPRVSLTDTDVRQPCIATGVTYELHDGTSLGDIKSSCDIDTNFFNLELTRQAPNPSSYGFCDGHAGPTTRVTDYPYPAQDCAIVSSAGGNRAMIAEEFAADADGLFIVKGPKSSTLRPALRVVAGTRSIARVLQSTGAGEGTWRTAVEIDGEPGDQLWKENFTESVRVERVRVFSVTNEVVNDREYVSLEGAQLKIEDPDAAEGAINECSGTASGFDLIACQLILTPTYRLANLQRADMDVLSNPIRWNIVSPAIEDNDRVFFIEFDLASTDNQTEAALMAEVPAIDLGGIALGDYASRMVRFTNVGNGYFVIDGVSVLPEPGRQAAYEAHRLDDPIRVPHPIYLESTEVSGEYTIGAESALLENPMYEVEEAEEGWRITAPKLHELDTELFGEPVTFMANTPVAMSESPIFAVPIPPANRSNPFKYPVYRKWTMPYILAPGESRTVQVMAKPLQEGVQKDRLIVSGYPYDTPGLYQEVGIELKVRGLIGPQVDHLPVALGFPRGSGAASTLSAIVVSYGDMNLTRGDVTIAAIDSLRVGDVQTFSLDPATPASRVIEPGNSESIRISYDPGCFFQPPPNGQHMAVLQIDTDAGLREIPLRGNPLLWAASSQSGCQPGN